MSQFAGPFWSSCISWLECTTRRNIRSHPPDRHLPMFLIRLHQLGEILGNQIVHRGIFVAAITLVVLVWHRQEGGLAEKRVVAIIVPVALIGNRVSVRVVLGRIVASEGLSLLHQERVEGRIILLIAVNSRKIARRRSIRCSIHVILHVLEMLFKLLVVLIDYHMVQLQCLKGLHMHRKAVAVAAGAIISAKPLPRS